MAVKTLEELSFDLREWSWAVVGLALLLAALTVLLIPPPEQCTVTLLDIIYAFSVIPLHELAHVAVARAFGAPIKIGTSSVGVFPVVYVKVEKPLPKDKYTIVALTPLFLVTLVGLATYSLGILPLGSFFFLLQNIAGSSGDIILVLYLAKLPRGVHVVDEGVRIVFRDANGAPVLRPKKEQKHTQLKVIIENVGKAFILSLITALSLNIAAVVVARGSFTIQVAGIPLLSCKKTPTETYATIHPALFLLFFAIFFVMLFFSRGKKARGGGKVSS